MFSLKGKVAIVTGGGSGIGKAVCLRFARAGAKVVVADIRNASDVAKEVKGIFVKTDVSNEVQVKRLMKTAVSKFGRLDIVVNNAGIDPGGGTLDELKEEIFDRAFSINAKGVMWGIKHAIGHIGDGGSIINTSSLVGLIGCPGYGAYSASKFTVVGLTKVAALEVAHRRIRVNCVCPGSVDTPMLQSENETDERTLAPYIYPMGRACTAEEVAGLYHFLASDESAMITGTAIIIDGGYSAGLGMNIMEPMLEIALGKR